VHYDILLITMFDEVIKELAIVGACLHCAYTLYKHWTNWSLRNKPSNDIKKGTIYLIESNTDTKFAEYKPIIRNDPFKDYGYYCQMIRKVPEDIPIKLILCTGGGSASGCSKILRTLKNHKSGYIAYVLSECLSAGTILAMGAKEIVMDNHSLLGKIDPTMFHGNENYTAICFSNIDQKHIDSHNAYMVNWGKYAINFIVELLGLALDGLPAEQSRDFIEKEFIYKETLHSKTFNYNDCMKIGLPVRQPGDDEKYFFG
jgi:hypothetical protein